MSIFVKAVPAPQPKTKDVRTVSIFYAIILVIMAVAQLFTFDEFLKLVTSFLLPGGAQKAHLIAALVVVAEVFALPFLLRMTLSPAFRFLSMLCGWAVAIIWGYIAIFMVATHSPIDNVGFLGTAISVMPGWWAILLSFAFAVFAAWSSWGMWPQFKAIKKHSK